MTEQKRPYRMRRRAEAEQRTRLRITESAVDLHGTVGPSRTTISAIARRAGVRRSTIYRHFPDETALFAACSAHWLAKHPFPDTGGWSALADPDARLRRALEQLYAYYRSNERLLGNIFRDEATMPVLKRAAQGYRQYLGAARDELMAGRAEGGAARRRALAAMGHALAFTTWSSLAREQGLSDRRAADLMCRLVAGVAVTG